MASTTLASTRHVNNLSGVSYSSYLKSADQTYMAEVANIPTLQGQLNSRKKKKTKDGEIDVFTADKYFNGGMDEENMGARDNQNKREEQVCRGHFQPSAPSIGSESSWNSQTAFLRTAMRNSSRKSKENKSQGKIFLANLGCKCSCSDKNSVDIDDHISEANNHGRAVSTVMNKSLKPADIILMNKLQLETDKLGVVVERNDYFSPPISDSRVVNKMQLTDQQEGARKSLEVFGCHDLSKGRNCFSHERRLNLLAWDAIPRVEEVGVRIPPEETQKDAESDASSDLFEIDCLSGTSKSALACHEVMSPTTCYAPSEASIEWSVVTASAADFAADSDHRQGPSTDCLKVLPAAKTDGNHEKRRPAGILSGCKSDKAVQVAGADVYRSPGKVRFEAQRLQRSESLAPLSRFHAESKVGGLSYKQSRGPPYLQ
ncbi:hypothetical protein Nepgr_003552 [Nepenthes gracilis]|uniref:Protein PHYTOCHROME KINASE SUBSTRATE 1-like n=1 Tax=Nepenthes gracilis TaxID=150966 RepID=A0AAD3RZU4_NEPGR|nr:hypothetical protein Nepgr_003552 [Nepenthes gracilis]